VLTTKPIKLQDIYPPKPGDLTNLYNKYERKWAFNMQAITKRISNPHSYYLKFIKQPHVRMMQPHTGISSSKAPASLKTVNLEAQKIVLDGINIYKQSLPQDYSKFIHCKTDPETQAKQYDVQQAITQFKAINPQIYTWVGRISFLLSIIEDSVIRVESAANSSCDIKKF
jgi:hypothetical protein